MGLTDESAEADDNEILNQDFTVESNTAEPEKNEKKNKKPGFREMKV